MLKRYPNADVVLAIPSLSIERRREIITMCNDLPCQFKLMPETLVIMERGGSFTAAIRTVKIDDLLGRTTVTFGKNELANLF